MILPRSSGLLLPIPCLPSRFGIGDLGPGAYRFVDFLHAARQRVWQVLPLNPTEAAFGHSPYHSLSAFAFSPLLISPELLIDDRLIETRELSCLPKFPEGRISYPEVQRLKESMLRVACDRFRQTLPDGDFDDFCSEQASWLDDFATFTAFHTHFRGKAWNLWPLKIRRRNVQAVQSLARKLEEEILRIKLSQFLFHRQWMQLKDYARDRGVRLLGDVPIYVPCDSADVWAHRKLFQIDAAGRPMAVSGVPPDYFSATGQLWGHPVYRWEVHRRTRYQWWQQRIAHQLSVFDHLRIDHFRGLVAYWEVPATEKTAIHGRWVETPTEDFFTELQRRFVSLPVIAEDLGYITADVREAIHRFGFPGMRVLMFGFTDDTDANPNAVHNIPENCVVYTGTHDNNTVKGWFEKEASRREKSRLSVFIGRAVSGRDAAWELIRLAMLSRARWAIIPVQDLLGLGATARINTPGQTEGNWMWRMTAGQLRDLPVKRLHEMTTVFDRA